MKNSKLLGQRLCLLPSNIPSAIVDLIPVEEFPTKYPIYSTRLRWRVFNQKGFICPTCNIVGTHALIWQDHVSGEGGIHSDLVGYNVYGDMVLITIDHTIPKSLGGPKTVANLAPYCSPCNSLKGQSGEKEFQKKIELLIFLAQSITGFTWR